MPDNNATISRFFEWYGKALSEGDLDGIVACWGIPAFVMSDRGIQPVGASEEVQAFFRQAIALYNAQGIAATRPEIQQIERFGKSVLSVDVRWINLDDNEAQKGTEEMRYVLKISADEKPKINIVVLKDSDR